MRSRDGFFVSASGALLLLVLAGFSHTYYLRLYLGTADLPVAMQQLPGYLHLHGIVLTLWFLLGILQPSLIAAGRADVHRRVGWVGAALAAALVIVTLNVIVNALPRLPLVGVPAEAVPLVIVGDLLALVVFVGLVSSAVLLRRSPETHKRLMLLASIAIVGPAVARIPGAQGQPLLLVGLQLAFLIAMGVHDRLRLGRIHRATAIGAVLIVVGMVAGIALGASSVGRAIVAALA
ncbi:MAG: hypothetical protein ABI640_00565 [Gammaproteobacteria bacterium]